MNPGDAQTCLSDKLLNVSKAACSWRDGEKKIYEICVYPDVAGYH